MRRGGLGDRQGGEFSSRGTRNNSGGRAAPRSKSQLRKKSHQQKQLEDNVKRTVYICDIEQEVDLRFR